MRPNQQNLESSKRWLNYAQSDLLLAEIERPDGLLLELLVYHAQQVAEKSFKAILILYGVEFPYTHNLTVLRELIPVELEMPAKVSDAAYLSVYSVTSRYPDDSPVVTEEEYVEAINHAGYVFSWASKIIAEYKSGNKG